VSFCGLTLHIDPDVYVPRWLSEQLALRAIDRLPATGTAIDICTGSGAVAAVLQANRPRARVVATDVDPRAVACALANGVDAVVGDLFAPLPEDLAGTVDLIVGVVPYVPTPELPLLQRDTFTFERPLSYDGGPDGTDILRRAIREAPNYLRQGGALLLELGGNQANLLEAELNYLGYIDVNVLRDEDGDTRGIEAALGRSRG
jgi:release factor glutamine methyltransferase